MANLKSLEINGVDIIDIFYPVGCLFYTTDNNFDPNSVFENTTWEKIEGRFIVGTSTSDSDFTSMKTGGEKTHTLTIAEMPSHNHLNSKSTLMSWGQDWANNGSSWSSKSSHQKDWYQPLNISSQGGTTSQQLTSILLHKYLASNCLNQLNPLFINLMKGGTSIGTSQKFNS